MGAKAARPESCSDFFRLRACAAATVNNNTKEHQMAYDDVFEGRWKQIKGDAKQFWGNLTDDDLDRSEGNRDKLVGALQERYGWEKTRAESDFDRFLESVRTPAGTHSQP
jgi:uncharacterized protein YjbJ (UPF0337 family)